jgi:N utilization substance protein A
VREVLVDDDKQEATVIVPDDQLSLAIGREGQNARLAAKLTGWKVDIKSETEFSQEEDELTYEEGEEADGRCAAVLSAGRRCPNAALPGSRYCGLPQHQALARFETNRVTVLTPLSDQEIQTLADSDADESEILPLVERATAEFAQAEQAEEAEEEAAAEAEKADEAAADETAEVEAEELVEAEEELEEAEEEAAEALEAEETEHGTEEATAAPAEELTHGSGDEATEEAAAETVAAEGPDDGGPREETAPVGATSPEESKAEGEDSEGSNSKES